MLCGLPPRRLLCSLCDNIMVAPIQTFRGEIACKTCYDDKTEESNICPIDGKVVERQPNYFLDNAIKMEIEQLACYCQNDECNWKGQLFELKKHVEQCKYIPMHSKGVQHVESYETHLGPSENQMEQRNCIYKNCPYKPEDSFDLTRHLKDESISRAYLYTSRINQLEDDFKTSTLKIEETMSSKTSEMESDIQQLKTQITLLMNLVIEMQNKTMQK